MTYLPRQLAAPMEAMLSKYPILALTGPRQAGKTTLLKHLLPEYRYLSMEDEPTRSYALNDPLGFLKQYGEKVIFDEVQRVPSLFSHLQGHVDQSGKMGDIIISGSQNFLLMRSITQTLAGRVCLFRLLPFDLKELKAGIFLPSDYRELILKGCYPALWVRDLEPAIFYANYLNTYVERDVTDLLGIRDMRQFRNFLSLCAARTGQLLNLNNLANECGISQPTAKAWLNILESSYIVFLVQPYFENFSKRIVKTPKLYFYDTGLVAHLLGIRELTDLSDQTLLGSLFENLIVSEIFKQNEHEYKLRQYWFWRDSAGHEIDLLTKRGLQFDLYEIKSSKTLLPQVFKGLLHFQGLVPDRIRSMTLVYGGDVNQERTQFQVRSWRSFPDNL